MVNLSTKVREQFTERIARLSDAALQNHLKVVAFKDGVQSSFSRGNNHQQAEITTLGQQSHPSFA